MFWETKGKGNMKWWDVRGTRHTASKSHSQSTVPQLRDWKTLNATTVLSESCTFTEIYTANKLAKNKSLTSEYKKTADKSAFFGSFSNFSANLFFCQRQTAVDFNFTGLIALQCLFSNDLCHFPYATYSTEMSMFFTLKTEQSPCLEHICYCYARLLQRKEGKEIMLYLSILCS